MSNYKNFQIITNSCVIDLATLNSINGFSIISDFNGYLGSSINNLGDINGDKITDFGIGAPFTSQSNTNSGSAYIIFGSKNGFSPSFDLATLNGGNGFEVLGLSACDNLGWSINSLGDVNGDGIGDFIIGAPNAIFGLGPGQAYVIFGNTTFPQQLNLNNLNGANGFIISGVYAQDNLGITVSAAGDMNNDGFNDIIVGDPNDNNAAGQAYIIYGSANTFPSIIYSSTLDGVNGLAIMGVNQGDKAGAVVAGLGDINGDGVDDVAIVAPNALIKKGSLYGEVYVVFGNAGGLPQAISLSSLNGNNGFAISSLSDSLVTLSSLGDVNNDGFNDLIVGSSHQNASVIFGSSSFPAQFYLEQLNGQNGFIITPPFYVNSSAVMVSGVGDVNNDGHNDILIGNNYYNSSSGEGILVYGASSFPAVISVASIFLDSSIGYRLINSNIKVGLGNVVAAAGDINADGIDDLAISSPEYNTSYIVYGSDGSSNIPCYMVPSPSPTPTATPTATSSATTTATASTTSSLTPSETSLPNNHNEAFSDGIIAGIAAGTAIGAAFIGVAAFWYGRTHGWWCVQEHDHSYGELNS